MNLTLEKTINPVFARHETFHPRFGWLKKGFDKVISEPDIFLKDYAPTSLGVGKNMVSAIKYWCHAYKIIEESVVEDQKTKMIKPTSFGKDLLAENGLDPYLEDLASLWLLHWNLTKPICQATTWYFVFNEFKKFDFTSDELLYELKDFKDREFPNNKIVDNSLIKDINCLTRMYVEQKINNTNIEESIDCPFVELNLIKTNDHRHFHFNIGDKPGLAPEIIVACCLDFYSEQNNNSGTIALSRLLYEKNSPGLVFKLSESSLYAAIENVAEKFRSIYLSDTAGLIQFYFKENPRELYKQILNYYYSGRK